MLVTHNIICFANLFPMVSFVRCLNLESASTSMDISPGARFHQATLYWQHPSLPWLTLFPRNSKANNGFHLADPERIALTKDWAASFRALFQVSTFFVL